MGVQSNFIDFGIWLPKECVITTQMGRNPMTETSNNNDLLVYTVPEAGALLGLNRNASYEAAKRGDIPTITIGKRKRVPKAAFHNKFGQ